VGSPSAHPKRRRPCAGFTLFEALVALTIILAFAAVLAPMLFHARRIMAGADGRIAAQILLRSLLDGPLDRASLNRGSLASYAREGEGAGLRWRVTAQPASIATTIRPGRRRDGDARPRNPAYRIVAIVSWAPGESISAETVRLAQSE
jgi:Tfp pilus assembly protein PilV